MMGVLRFFFSFAGVIGLDVYSGFSHSLVRICSCEFEGHLMNHLCFYLNPASCSLTETFLAPFFTHREPLVKGFSS